MWVLHPYFSHSVYSMLTKCVLCSFCTFLNFLCCNHSSLSTFQVCYLSTLILFIAIPFFTFEGSLNFVSVTSGGTFCWCCQCRRCQAVFQPASHADLLPSLQAMPDAPHNQWRKEMSASSSTASHQLLSSLTPLHFRPSSIPLFYGRFFSRRCSVRKGKGRYFSDPPPSVFLCRLVPRVRSTFEVDARLTVGYVSLLRGSLAALSGRLLALPPPSDLLQEASQKWRNCIFQTFFKQ